MIGPTGRRAPDEAGQMMILTAVILLIGFIALAGMLARVNQVASQTSAEGDRPILRAVGPLGTDLDQAITRMVEPEPVGLGLDEFGDAAAGKPTLDNAVEALMIHLQDVLASEGLFLDYSMECRGKLEGVVMATLTDGDAWIQIESRTFPRAPVCDPIETTYVACLTPVGAGTLNAFADCADLQENNAATTVAVTEVGTPQASGLTTLVGTSTTGSVSVGNGAGCATGAACAFTSDNTRAAVHDTGDILQIGGFTVPSGATGITQVIIGFEGREVSNGDSNPTIRLTYTGFADPSPVTFPISGTAEPARETDITADRAWTVANIGSLVVRLDDTGGDLSGNRRLDVDQLYVKIVYTYSTYTLAAPGSIQGTWSPAVANGAIPNRFLDIRAMSVGETFNIQVCQVATVPCPGASWTTRYTVSSAAWQTYDTHELSDVEFNGGLPRIRIVDANPTGTTQGTLTLDYIRINVS